ncbi:hypothetical protein HDU79_007342 [Rhizoclosmatium sp. JEL0117]|nr:hypothetical protein HDU79_007342 [Rhizoclosmatium sp. JEL0117]
MSSRGPPPPPPAKPKSLSALPIESSDNSFSATDAARAARASGSIASRIAALGLNLNDAASTKTDDLLPNSTSNSNSTKRLSTPTPVSPSRKPAPPPPPPPSRRQLARPATPSAFQSNQSNQLNQSNGDPLPPRPTQSHTHTHTQNIELRRKASLDSQHTVNSAASLSFDPSVTVAPPSPVPQARLRPQPRRSGSVRAGVQPGPSHTTSPPDSPLIRPSHTLGAPLLDDESSSSSFSASIPKRDRILQELVETERSFLNDLNVLRDVYILPATHRAIFSTSEIKLLFGNVDDLISLSSSFLDVLTEKVNEDRVSEAFLDMAPTIEETYSQYCKNNETQMTRLFDYTSPHASEVVQSFFKECQSQLAGRTNAWDLSSLIIKPVQRVLKYPLLLSSLLKETNEYHPDYERLKVAATEMARIGEEINDVKKRKDTVEKYVEGKGGINVMHGISKKFARGIEELKHVTKVVDGTRDDTYAEIHDKFMLQHTKIMTFSRDLNQWLKTVKDTLEAQDTLSATLEDVYLLGNTQLLQANSGSSGMLSGIGGRSLSAWGSLKRKTNDYGSRTSSSSSLNGHGITVAEYRRICAKLGYEPWKEAEAEVKQNIVPAINSLLSLLKGPLLLIKKRDMKLLDHDRAKRMHAKGEPVDKALDESSQAYVSINAQLILELPKLSQLVSTYMDKVVGAFVAVQRRVHEAVLGEMRVVVNSFEGNFSVGGRGHGGPGVVEEFKTASAADPDVARRVYEIGLLENWRENVWRNDDFIDHTDERGRFAFGKSVSNRNLSHRGGGGGAGSVRAESVRSGRTDDDVVTSSIGRRTSSLMQSTIDGFEVVSLYAFTAEVEDELDLQAGDVLWIDSVSGRNGDFENEDWWHARNLVDGRDGWIPFNYVQRH